MEKNIYLLTKTTYYRSNGEFLSDERNFKFFILDENTAEKIKNKISIFNDVINGLYNNSEVIDRYDYEYDDYDDDCYDYPSNCFEKEDGTNILHYLKNENDLEKAKEKLKEDGFNEKFMSFVEMYYKEIKGTFYEENMACLYDYHDIFNLIKIDVEDLSSVESVLELKLLV